MNTMMQNSDIPNEYYFYSKENKSQNNVAKFKKSKDNLDKKMNSNSYYISRLTTLQIFSTIIITIAAILQGVAIGTSDWFVLNVNEYIPTSKGGLWNYCYISSTNFNGFTGEYMCLKYEELPNFAIFVNSRLYDSRILLVCSSGFCGLLLIIEIFGILCMCLAEKKLDIFDSFVASRSTKFKIPKNESSKRNELFIPASSPKPVLKTTTADSTKIIESNGIDSDETTNSARFTTSIIVNANLNERNYDNNISRFNEYHTTKPTGYFAYLAIALITLVGSVMDFVLKVSGFALYDSYIQNLLKFNTVFLAYRSYSYWMMIISICLVIFFWLFKVFSTKYVINLTKNLIKNQEEIILKQDNISLVYSNPSQSVVLPSFDPFKTNYTTISRIQGDIAANDNDDKNYKYFYNTNNDYMIDNNNNLDREDTMQIKNPIRSTYVYDLDSNEDDLSSSFYSSKLQSINSNYFLEYVNQQSEINLQNQLEDYLPAYDFNYDGMSQINDQKIEGFEKESTNSIIRF